MEIPEILETIVIDTLTTSDLEDTPANRIELLAEMHANIDQMLEPSMYRTLMGFQMVVEIGKIKNTQMVEAILNR